jgi:hypothetical protein
MSETKHTPLPWWIDESGEYSNVSELQSQVGICAYSKNDIDKFLFVAETCGGVGRVGVKNSEVELANARLIVTSVNARPRVEELVSLLLAWLDNQPDGRGEVELRLLKKAREVESALGGKAE